MSEVTQPESTVLSSRRQPFLAESSQKMTFSPLPSHFSPVRTGPPVGRTPRPWTEPRAEKCVASIHKAWHGKLDPVLQSFDAFYSV